MPDLEKVIKGLECCQADGYSGFPNCGECPYESYGGCSEHDVMHRDALELLKAQQWVSVKDRLPTVGDSYIVAGKQRYPGEPWEYFTDVADSHGSYIDDFWDTFNDWKEGQETHITHWMPLPEPPKEEA